MTQTRICHKCKKPVQESIKPLFRDTCYNCGSYLHCCLNCSLYDEARHNKCKSPTTEVVADREKFNFCDEFRC